MQKYQNNVQDQFGNAITGVTVTIRTNPGGVLATIYSDNGVTAKANPFTNDSDGEFFFYAANGRYDVELTGNASETKQDIILLDIPTTGTTIRINTDIVTASPPTTEAVVGQYEIWDLDTTDNLAQIGFNGSSTIRIANRMHGGLVQLNAEDSTGSPRVMFQGDPDVGTELRHGADNTINVVTVTDGIEVRSGGNTDAENRVIRLAHQDGTDRAFIGHAASSTLTVRNQIHGGPTFLQGEDAGGTVRSICGGDPDGDSDLFHAGVSRIRARVSGIAGILSDGNTDTENRLITGYHADLTARWQVGHPAVANLYLRNFVHGGKVIIDAEDAGGTSRTILDADPDGTTILRGDTVVRVESSDTGGRALQGDAGGATGLYYNNQQNIRTSDESASDIGMGAEVRHNDDAFYPVGMNVAPEDAGLDTGNVTLGQEHVGKMLTYNTATARSLLFNNVAALKLGAMFALKVGPSAGTLTGDGGTGVQIRWWNGSGWTTTAAAGNITIGVGSYTIWKETDTLYWIDGPTLS
jgi:hypothetical protein